MIILQNSIFNQEVQEEMAQSILNLIDTAIEKKLTPRGALQPENAAEYCNKVVKSKNVDMEGLNVPNSN